MITFLDALIVGLKIVEVMAVIAIILIGIDQALGLYKGRVLRLIDSVKARFGRKSTVVTDEYKAKHRQAEEQAAYEGFFEESYVPVFDSYGGVHYCWALVPTDEAKDYYHEMDQLVAEHGNDAQIFTNTEEL